MALSVPNSPLGQAGHGRGTESAGETVTLWIQQLKGGDADAAQNLWQRYYARVVELARRKLKGAVSAAADEEDVALSAFNSFCLGVRDGRFPKLTDRDSLWSLLVAITAHKSVDLIRHENRKKRGGRGIRSDDDSAPAGVEPLSQIIRQQPTPEFAALMAEQFESLIVRLHGAEDADLIQITVGKMLGESNAEIAHRLGCARRTIERKLQLVYRIWENECQ